MRNIAATAIIVTLGLIVPAAVADEAEANRLFVESARLFEDARNKSLEERWELYRQIKENLDRIVEDHSDSSLAVKLVIGETIGPIDRKRIEKFLEDYAPEKRAEARAVETALRRLLSPGRRIALWCRRSPDSQWQSAAVSVSQFDGSRASGTFTLLGKGRRAATLETMFTQREPVTVYLEPPRGLRISGAGLGSFEFVIGEREVARNEGNHPLAWPSIECNLSLDPASRLEIRLAGCAADDARCRAGVLLDFAVATARAIEDATDRSQALREIAAAQAEAGRRAEASRLFAEAAETARAIKDARFGFRSSTLGSIVRAQARAGDVAGALETARDIEDASDRSRALREIAAAQAQAGDVVGALETAGDIEKAAVRGEALTAIASAQAKAGDAAGARRTFAQALETAHAVEDAWRRSDVLHVIARAQAQAGDPDGARRTFAEALETARSIENAAVRSRALGEIATAQAHAGDPDGARRTVAEARDAARAIESAYHRGPVLGEIATAQVRAGDPDGARRTFAEALETARAIEDASSRSDVLREIATAQADAGDPDGARPTFAEALETARAIEAPFRRLALGDLAKAQAQAGDVAGALETARAIEDAEERSRALKEIAQALGEAGDLGGARRTFAEARQSAGGIEDADRGRRVIAEILVAEAVAELALRRLEGFPPLSQLDRRNYRDAGLFAATDCYGSGRTEVPKLACLATVYTMIARGLGEPDAMIDDFYTDPRKGRCGVGAVPSALPAGIGVDGPGEEKPLDPEVVEASIRNGLPVILHGRSPNLVDHFVLVVGTYRDDGDRLVLVVNDPLPDHGTVEPKQRELVVAQAQTAGLFARAAWQATGENGFVFDRMRLVYRR